MGADREEPCRTLYGSEFYYRRKGDSLRNWSPGSRGTGLNE